MKGLHVFALLLVILLLAGCTEPSGLTGTWVAEIPITVLGLEEQKETTGEVRFIFRPDGTGSWSTEIPGGNYPEAVREFHYLQEGNNLTLSYGEDAADTEFTLHLTEDSLKLESQRASFDLIRIK